MRNKAQLPSIFLYRRPSVINNYTKQMGNGIKGGCENMIHSLRDILKTLVTSNFVIITLDPSNGYNNIDRGKTLNIMHKNLPGPYISSLNVYGQKSYTVLSDEITPVEQGFYHGYPLEQTSFNVGISQNIDYVENNLHGTKIWYCDDVFLWDSRGCYDIFKAHPNAWP